GIDARPSEQPVGGASPPVLATDQVWLSHGRLVSRSMEARSRPTRGYPAASLLASDPLSGRARRANRAPRAPRCLRGGAIARAGARGGELGARTAYARRRAARPRGLRRTRVAGSCRSRSARGSPERRA